VLTAADAIDIFEARLVLEPSVLKEAVGRAAADDVTRVHAALADYERAVAAGYSPAELSQLNWAFHEALSRPSGRLRSLGLLSSLYRSADRYLGLQIDSDEARGKALEDHRAIAAAFAAGHAGLTQKLLAGHISDARNDVIRSLAGIAPESQASVGAQRWTKSRLELLDGQVDRDAGDDNSEKVK
jgi:DNA-binding GntR family transcriptional regulator